MCLKDMLVFPVGTTLACHFAADYLKKKGFSLVDHPTPDVTHVLLDVPSFGGNKLLRDGTDPKTVLERLPVSVTVIGGNLAHPALDGHATLDLLKDETYLAANAAITADCALQVAAAHMCEVFADSSVLVIGWGRIGKCLGNLLKNAGASVTIAARKETDRAMIQALGFQAVDTARLSRHLAGYSLLFNTVPEPVFDEQALLSCKQCPKIDLASKQGLLGEDVIWARGLPGVYAPKSSGRLIARTILRLIEEGHK